MDTRKVPKFVTEAEEAQWWYDHREELTRGQALVGSTPATAI
jgi:hypothetical protein